MKSKIKLISAMAKALYLQTNKREMPENANKVYWERQAVRYLSVKARV